MDQYHPDRILIEPSGVGKLSDVIAAVQNAHLEVQLNSFVTVVDALKAKMYLKNFLWRGYGAPVRILLSHG